MNDTELVHRVIDIFSFPIGNESLPSYRKHLAVQEKAWGINSGDLVFLWRSYVRPIIAPLVHKRAMTDLRLAEEQLAEERKQRDINAIAAQLGKYFGATGTHPSGEN